MDDKKTEKDLRLVQGIKPIREEGIQNAKGIEEKVTVAVRHEENNKAMFEDGAEERANQISSKMLKQEEIEKHQQEIEEDEDELDLV